VKSVFLSILKYSIILGLILFLLWYAFYNMDLYPTDPDHSGLLQEKLNFVYQEWLASSRFWLFISGSVSVISHFQRAIRWKMLLSPLGHKVKTSSAFFAVINGYFVNLMIPRGGEISRPVMLKRLEGVPTATSIGTVVAERVIDLFFLLVLIGVVVVFQLTRFYDFFSDLYSNDPQEANTGIPTWVYALIVVGTGLFGITLLFFFNKGLYEKLKVKLSGILKDLKEGVLVVKRLENNWLFIGHSLLIWVFYYAMLYTGLLAYGPTSDLGSFDALTIFVIGGIAMAIPLPGGAGSFHVLIPLALIHLCGVPDDMGKPTAFATVYHLYQSLVLVITGGICLLISQKIAAKRSLEENTT
jgi:uncharacterized membrane protein YbhN (UPF0104 family)